MMSATSDLTTVIVCEIGRQRYALPIDVVQEVVPLARLTALAGAPPELRGLLNLRGAHVPVLDGAVLMGGAPIEDLESRILVLRGATGSRGLIVDHVSTVEPADLTALTPLPDGQVAPFLIGVLDADGAPLLLDVDKLERSTPR